MSRRAALALGLVVLCACGIDAVGTSPTAETQSLPDAGPIGGDAAPDASSCRSITTVTLTPGSLVAPKATKPPTLDGDLSDWDTCFVPLDKNNAQLLRDMGGGGAYVSGEVSVVHDGTKLWIAARVKGIAPLGDAAAMLLHQNDSFEIYFDGDGTTAQGYGDDTVQIVVDYTGRTQSWRNGPQVQLPELEAAARVAPDGSSFTIEVEITPASFGRASFAPTMGFDFGFNNGSGTSQLSQVVWFQKCKKTSGCGCTNGGDAPYCDSRQFGALTLAP